MPFENFQTKEAKDQASTQLFPEWANEQKIFASQQQQQQQERQNADHIKALDAPMLLVAISPEKQRTADRFDKELSTFAASPNTSENIKALQNIVKTFNAGADKADAVKAFGPAYLRWDRKLTEDAGKTFREMELEATSQAPQRKDYEAKLTKFFDRVQNLPVKDNERVMKLLTHMPGETQADRDNRVVDGLKGSPKLQVDFKLMQAAKATLDNSRSQRQIELQAVHDQQLADKSLGATVRRTVVLRSQI